jgi:4-carboxymuconolactone decarboxylase
VTRSQTPRLQPLENDEFEQRVGVALPRNKEVNPQNLMNTLARHADLVKGWLPFGLRLMRGVLPPRDRELLTLRTAVRCRSTYEWGQHAVLARSVGISDAEIGWVVTGSEAPGWSALERLLIVAADELHDTSTVSDEVWAGLESHYDERQLIEIPMVVGHFHTIAFAANTLGVAPEEGRPALPG